MARRTQQSAELVAPVYKAWPTARKFHKSRAQVRGLMGPVGAGKTVACIAELYSRALEQKPFNNVRRTRFVIVRATYPELINTTLKTFEDWIPPQLCHVSMGATLSGMFNAKLPDGTLVESEFIFLSVGGEEDIEKLRSFEITGAFINEASEMREAVLTKLKERCGRYPPVRWGGPTWHGVIMDTNPPDDGHWWYRLAEVERPSGFEFFRQPPALIRCPGKEPGEPPTYMPNPEAENIPYLPGATPENPEGGYDYYLNQTQGASEDWIRVFVMGEYGTIASGRPVFPDYSDSLHLAKSPLIPFKGVPVVAAFDFGLTPAAVFGQQVPGGGVRILGELTSENMGMEKFMRDVFLPELAKEKWKDCRFHCVGDPAGAQRGQADETTCFDIIERFGFDWEPASTNAFLPRREAVSAFLIKLIDGKPGFLMDPGCQVLRKGLLGSYKYRRLKVGVGDRYSETPEKNQFSHVADACQYLLLYFRGSSPRSPGELSSADSRYRVRPVVPGNPAGWA